MHSLWLTRADKLWKIMIEAKTEASLGKGTFTFTCYHYMGDEDKCTFVPIL